MSHDYSFAIVPFDLDGDYKQLHKPDPEEEGEYLDQLVDGVELLGFGGKGNFLPMNGAFTHIFNEASGGCWQAFLVGGPLKWDSNGRFIVLDKRRQADIPLLRHFVGRMIDGPAFSRFEQLFMQMDRVLAANQGRMVALVIN